MNSEFRTSPIHGESSRNLTRKQARESDARWRMAWIIALITSALLGAAWAVADEAVKMGIL